jgi:hypothetical protein
MAPDCEIPQERSFQPAVDRAASRLSERNINMWKFGWPPAKSHKVSAKPWVHKTLRLKMRQEARGDSQQHEGGAKKGGSGWCEQGR